MINSLIALIALTVGTIVIYFVSITVVESMISEVLLTNSINNIENNLNDEKRLMEEKLEEIERMMMVFQASESEFFEDLDRLVAPENGLFDVHDNGVFYKIIDNGGSSLYYSSDTIIGPEERKKAYFTEVFDSKYKSAVEVNDLVAQVYINTYDNMNRLYPFMADAPGQYGPTLEMEDYNFYYLADLEHNPSKEPVWTKAYLDPAGLGWMVSCIVPIYNGDFLEGVTGADITIDLLIEQFMDVEIDSINGILVTDSEDSIVAMNKDVQELFQVSELTDHEYTETIEGTIHKPDDYGVTKLNVEGIYPFKDRLDQNLSKSSFNANDDTYHIVSTTLATTDWELYVIVDEALVLSDVQDVSEIFRSMLLYQVLMIIILTVFYLIWFSSKAKRVSASISVPIVKLGQAISQFGRNGNEIELDHQVEISEINELNDTFIDMSIQLDARTKELIDKEAEKKVQEQLAIKYREEARLDTLTGLYNRRKIDDVLDEEVSRSRRYYHPLSIILTDIDDFKRINDQFGHLEGDQVLKEFAAILTRYAREDDIVGRWGGEEFLIICPYTKAKDATVLAEHLRKTISDNDFGALGQITASFGVAEYQGNDRRSFFEKVDRAMYEAKNKSKNVVVNYEEGE